MLASRLTTKPGGNLTAVTRFVLSDAHVGAINIFVSGFPNADWIIKKLPARATLG